MKKYKLDQNNIAFIHLVHSAFAGLNLSIELLNGGKGITKKQLLKAIQNTVQQTDVALVSEYIRGELVKKGVLQNGGKEFCSFDTSPENDKELVAVVYTPEELQAERLKNSPTSSPEAR